MAWDALPLTLGTPKNTVGRISLRVLTSDPFRASGCANAVEQPRNIGPCISKICHKKNTHTQET